MPLTDFQRRLLAALAGRFVVPRAGEPLAAQGIVTHFGTPGGVLPRVADAGFEGSDERPS